MVWALIAAFAAPRVEYGGPTSLPQLGGNDHLWVVPIEVDGVGPRFAVFDSGFTSSTIDPLIAEALGLRVRGQGKAEYPSGLVVPARSTTLPLLKLGDHVLRDLPCDVFDLAQEMDPRRTGQLAFVFGADVIRHFYVTLDPVGNALVLVHPDEGPPIEPGHGVAALRWIKNRKVGVEVAVNGRTAWPALDTGASDVLLDGRRFGLMARRSVTRPNGRVVPIYVDEKIELGGIDVSPHRIGGLRYFGHDGLLGMTVLSQAIISLDFKSMRMLFTPVEPIEPRTWAEWRELGVPAPVRLGASSER